MPFVMQEKEFITTSSKRHYSEANFDGYQPAPLLIVGGGARRRLVHKQDALAENFDGAVHEQLSPIVKPHIVDFVAHAIRTRMQQREGFNSFSYLRRLNKGQPDFSQMPELSKRAILRACHSARGGHGTVEQKHIARSTFEMGSIELANLTVINEFRRELEPLMWDEVSELVGRDATPAYDAMYKLKILGFDRDIQKSQHIGAMRIGMKRVIGELDDGSVIKARTSAIINMSPSSGFDQSLVKLFRETEGDTEVLENLDEFKAAVSWLVQSELNSGIVLARNETVYENNPMIQEKIAIKHGYAKAA